MLSHRTIFSARSVSVFLGSTLLFYVALIGTGKGPINMINNLSMQSLFCLSDPKPIHLTDHYSITENTRMRLVVAYMRGGSTLTADIVRHTEADFYQFEPLHGITIAVQENRPVQFLNGTIRNITKEELESVYTEMIYHWFTCNFKNIDLPGLTSSFIKTFTPEHGKYYSCINPVNTTKSKLDLVKQCIPILHLKCLESKNSDVENNSIDGVFGGKTFKMAT
ncbi:uncharacterized protein LOC128158806 [Crassostrea angulata]|uniref:uncharacterized protein LOC128158806 n=1 Tax=Magallana angulata TaxID=2784310 RepID=UPI0022B1CEA9|nr:uncharacterized protein LOC128158806 [Crassostrea angulata]